MNFREGNVILNCVISAMTASKLMRKGCMVYLAYVIDFRKGEVGIKKPSHCKRVSRCVLEELLGLPPKKEVKVLIDVLPSISSIA